MSNKLPPDWNKGIPVITHMDSYPLDEAGAATLKKWGDIDKIVVEAAHEVASNYSEGFYLSAITRIIKSAIGKADSEGWQRGWDDAMERARLDAPRAAAADAELVWFHMSERRPSAADCVDGKLWFRFTDSSERLLPLVTPNHASAGATHWATPKPDASSTDSTGSPRASSRQAAAAADAGQAAEEFLREEIAYTGREKGLLVKFAQWLSHRPAPAAGSRQAAATQEWTPEIAAAIYSGNAYPFKAIADAHNAEIAAERNKHCKDCCCARSWEALAEYGKGIGSIPEHIEALVAAMRQPQRPEPVEGQDTRLIAKKIVYQIMDYDDEDADILVDKVEFELAAMLQARQEEKEKNDN